MTPQVEIQLIAVVVAAACAIPGVFLVLRGMSMMSDAISHSILPGIVIGFFLTQDLSSPFLIGAAAASGLVTVMLVEGVNRTRLVKEDAAIGLVFPALFSIGVILIARYAGDVHLDVDAVLLGELAFAPFDRMIIAGTDVGPRALFVMGSVLLLNVGFVSVFYKELKISTFDAGLAAALGFAPVLLHYVLMGVVSVTAVAAFDAVGSILVVALMIGPAAAAHLLTDRLPVMLLLSGGIAAAAAIAGYQLAHALDGSIAGAMASATGVAFLLAFLGAPQRGVLARVLTRRRQRWEFARRMLVVHLLQHEDLPEEQRESRIDHLQEHLHWNEPFAGRVVRTSIRAGYVERQGDRLVLTGTGREVARSSVVNA